MRYPNTTAAYGNHRLFQQILGMGYEYFFHQHNTLRSRYIRQTHHPAMRCLFDKKKLAEIFVHRNQHPALAGCPFEQYAIARVRSSFPRLDHIMTVFPQVSRQARTGAAINKELHRPAIRTASSVSWAIIAWA